MSIFRNPNEKGYVGGKKHWTDVIKNQSEGDAIFFKCPEEDFNTNSTLIVMPGEVAYLVKDGSFVAKFGEGKHQLSTENYPFISRIKNAFSGGISTFNCIIYYVRKSLSHEILWGTDSPIIVRDKVLGLATKIKSRGSYRIQIQDPDKVFETFVSKNLRVIDTKDFDSFFSGQIRGEIKDKLANYFKKTDQELIELSSKTKEIAVELLPAISDVLKEYGLLCEAFSIAAIDVDDSELRKKYDEIGLDAYRKQVEARADIKVMEILGDDWEKQKKVDIMTKAAENSGAASVGIGLMTGSLAFDSSPSSKPLDDIGAKLRKLKMLLDEGLISKEDYEFKKQKLLEDF